MALCHGGASHKALRHGAPASNKPHPAEKSTLVWLAIWRTWAGFANSQLRHAAFRSIYLYIDVPLPLAATLGCCSNRRKSFGPSAPIAYATSASPPNEAAAWPGASVGWQMMLSAEELPLRGRPCMEDNAAASGSSLGSGKWKWEMGVGNGSGKWGV